MYQSEINISKLNDNEAIVSKADKVILS